MNLIQQLEQEEIARLNKTIPEFAPGDTVVVSVRVVEGNRSRLQAYEGVVISRRNRGQQQGGYQQAASQGGGYGGGQQGGYGQGGTNYGAQGGANYGAPTGGSPEDPWRTAPSGGSTSFGDEPPF